MLLYGAPLGALWRPSGCGCGLSLRPFATETPLPRCRSMRKQSVKTVLQSVVLNKYTDCLPVMKARQRSAFPPNYIHSIDSSHMMLTALACAQEGACRLSSLIRDTAAGTDVNLCKLLQPSAMVLHPAQQNLHVLQT